jgi:hypothetical protein
VSIQSRSGGAVAFRPLGSGDQFEQFMRVVQPFRKLVLVVAERCGRQLRGHARFLQPRIRGHEANLIDADSLSTSERGLQLQRQLGGFGFPGGKRTYKPPQFVLRYAGEELHAGQPGR